jgi:hypothetical protein
MHEVLLGTTTSDIFVATRASASMRVSSDSVSNEIDERDSQYEKHAEQRI